MSYYLLSESQYRIGLNKTPFLSQTWGHIPIIPVFGRLKLEGYEFEASLSYVKDQR